MPASIPPNRVIISRNVDTTEVHRAYMAVAVTMRGGCRCIGYGRSDRDARRALVRHINTRHPAPVAVPLPFEGVPA